MAVVSAGYVGGTRGLGIVPSAADVLGMCVVRGTCVTCVCVWLGWRRRRRDEWTRGLGLGLPNLCEHEECWTCVGGEWGCCGVMTV